MTEKPKLTLVADETFNVRLTDAQCNAVANCITNYYKILTREKISLPPTITVHVESALHAMKEGLEGKTIILASN